jgi:mRNA-degrading endonuclease RelE of RelBE toxin-antitoxin system
MPYNSFVFSFIETKLFTRLVQEYLTDDEYQKLQTMLIEQPEAGDIIRGSGGVRKLRWKAPGRGKRGGYRVIYYITHARNVIWMLTLYSKNVADNIPAHVLRAIRNEVENG